MGSLLVRHLVTFGCTTARSGAAFARRARGRSTPNVPSPRATARPGLVLCVRRVGHTARARRADRPDATRADPPGRGDHFARARWIRSTRGPVGPQRLARGRRRRVGPRALGIERFALLGWSYPGFVAALYAARHPALVRKTARVRAIAAARNSEFHLSPDIWRATNERQAVLEERAAKLGFATADDLARSPTSWSGRPKRSSNSQRGHGCGLGSRTSRCTGARLRSSRRSSRGSPACDSGQPDMRDRALVW